ncbi:MAG: type II toxin-antitoxin system RelE/ParE family toxin [Thermodesulfobacteriota bacterium]|nr:type II toxin-antitoxin system RelE/ParE family toxin [Thermodesulfobacteriota bacterium]
MTYKPEITDVCLSLIEKISNKKTQAAIIDRIEALRTDPEKQGKALVKRLAGFRSIHAAGRYHVIYKIDNNATVVWVVAAGIRKEGDKKDIYKIAKKLLRLGLLELDA